jgi:hypothetical protein
MECGTLMKPVIKKQTYYSLLLMRDDGGVRSIRMKNTTLRFLVILFFLFIFTGGAGIGLGVHYWKRYAEFIPEYREKERALAEALPELIRLQSIEAVLLEQSNGTLSMTMNTELGVETPDSVLLTAQANGNASRGNNATAETAANATVADIQADSRNATAPLSNATAQTDTVASQTAAEPGVPAISGENSPVRVNEFSAQATSQQSLRIRYDLSVSRFAETGQDNGPISGSAKYIVVFSNGTRLDLPQNNPSNARFAISRMKPMMATSRLPQGYSTADIQQVDVFIEVNGDGVYAERFSFPH